MKALTVLGILFYTTILIIISGALIAFSLNWLPVADITSFLDYIQLSINARLVVGLSGVLLFLISVSFAQTILGRFQKEKTIAFNNPSGQVTISLSAIEDLIKRITAGLHEIKEIRPDVVAGKRGIEVKLRLVLRSDISIPDLTGRLQELVKNRVQEILGIEEQILVKIHVAKIISYEEREKKRRDSEKEEPTIPFQNFGKI